MHLDLAEGMDVAVGGSVLAQNQGAQAGESQEVDQGKP